jgi:hypothetical protein
LGPFYRTFGPSSVSIPPEMIKYRSCGRIMIWSRSQGKHSTCVLWLD